MTVEEFLEEWNGAEERVLVHTSGSTGKPKPMWVEKSRMLASAQTTCDFLGLHPGDTALLCLSVDYIAGKMMVVRSLERHLQLLCVPPSNHPLASLQEPFGKLDLVAMVPSQVYCSLENERERSLLMSIRNLIIGGGSVDAGLEAQLRCFPNAVWSTYGMTETLSHIALRRINGEEASEWYCPFDGVDVVVDADNCLVINAPKVHCGELVTNDIAEIHTDGRRFRILGRKDNVICSGGVKVQMEDVENELREHVSVPFAITKRKEPKFGEIVVMVVADDDGGNERLTLESAVFDRLPAYHRPKELIHVNSLPLTETGKVKRDELMKIALRNEKK